MFEPDISFIGKTMRTIGDLSPRPPLVTLLARPPMPARPPWPFWPLALAAATGDAAALAGAVWLAAPDAGPARLAASALGFLVLTLAGLHGRAALLGGQRGLFGWLLLAGALLAAVLLGLGAAGRVALLGGGLAAASLAVWRLTGLGWALGAGRAARFAPRAVVVGADAGTLRALRRLPGLRLAGIAGDATDLQAGKALATRPALPWLGPIEAIPGLARRGAIEMVVVGLPVAASERMADLRAVLEEVPVSLGLFVPQAGMIGTRGMQAGRLLALAEVPIGGGAGVLKRAEDMVLGVLALAVMALPMLVIALAIRLDSPGPVLFRQARIGRGGRVFKVLKFRTMQHHLADPAARTQARAGDARLTRIGAWLRRSSADELPQLFNVLRGEMSLVGPRPHAQGTRAGELPFELADEHYAARHQVRPGITGLAQVRGLRGPTETEEKLRRRVAADLEYIESWSIWLDLWVLARTAATVLGMRNAI